MANVVFNTTEQNIEWHKAPSFKAGDICIGKKGAVYIIAKSGHYQNRWGGAKFKLKALSIVSGQFAEGQTMMRIMRKDESVTIKN